MYHHGEQIGTARLTTGPRRVVLAGIYSLDPLAPVEQRFAATLLKHSDELASVKLSLPGLAELAASESPCWCCTFDQAEITRIDIPRASAVVYFTVERADRSGMVALTLGEAEHALTFRP